MSGLVGLEDVSSRVGGDDGRRTALNQNLQLLLGLAPCLALPFDFVDMAEDNLAVFATSYTNMPTQKNDVK